MRPKKNPQARYRVKIPVLEDYEEFVACRSACPLETDVAEYARAIAEGDYQRAYLIARWPNPLASVCGRICQAPCEKACRRGEDGDPVAIRALKRFACDRGGTDAAVSVLKGLRDRTSADCAEAAPFRERVAVIGSGPAGLAAAHDLALLGYPVTIFEAGAEPGGMLRMGVPAFRMPREVLRREIETILDLGVELRLDSAIGKEKTVADLLREGYGAVFVAVGLQESRLLPIEGLDLKGVWSGLAYLRDFEITAVGKKCVVIGGGGVALDCAQVALRQGARLVSVASVETWQEMPAGPSEKEDALEEGVKFIPGVGPKRILGEDGRVTGVEFLKVESLLDERGRFNPRLRAGTERVLEADTVLVAVGQSAALPVPSGTEGIERTAAGTIAVNEDLATSLPGVFAGGDVAAGPRGAVDAIAAGQKAARSIHAFLRGRRWRRRRRGRMRPLEAGSLDHRAGKIRAARPPKRPLEERIRGHQEIELAYEEAEARLQAGRCRRCQVQTVFDRRLCILCGTCVDTCVNSAYKMVRLEDVAGDERLEGRLRAHYGEAWRRRPMTAIIKEEARCVRCGLCSRRCPTGAITLESFHVEEEWEDEGEHRGSLPRGES